jgi:SAM-dependent methyltransferase
MHQSSLDNMRYFKETYLKDLEKNSLNIFDLGSLDVNGSYREIFENPRWIYKGLDVTAGKNVDIVLKDNYRWKEIKSNSVDILISGQAFEHIEFFWITMLEIARILKPGGLCCIVAPSSGPEHKYPVDCWRFFPDGFSALARFAGLKIEQLIHRCLADEKLTTKKDMWKDTVLICRKRRLSFFYAYRHSLWLRLMHWVLTYRLPN